MITAAGEMGNDARGDERRRAIRDCVVVGGGVIGLSVARELAGAGLSVTIVERDAAGRAASHAAAGMLAPQAEADCDDAFFRLARESRALYPEFARALLEETGTDVELDRTGTLYVALTEKEAARLERRYEWQRAAGLSVERLSSDEARRLEPHLTRDLRAALLFPDDWQVENRRLTHALAASCARRGIELLTNTEVLGVETLPDERRVAGVSTSRGTIAAAHVVVASGAWASRLAGAAPELPADGETSAQFFRVEPVRGQMLCLEASPPVVRHVIYGARAYLVPRRDGRLLVGATVEEVGFDPRVTASGIGELAAGAREIVPRAGDLPFAGAWAGLRPRSSDRLPVIGRAPHLRGLVFAAGHYRNGILLAPLTARMVRDLIAAPERAHSAAHDFAPARFAHLS